jgi:HPt (histidine-containing phosphotransfer) domain-containing protein
LDPIARRHHAEVLRALAQDAGLSPLVKLLQEIEQLADGDLSSQPLMLVAELQARCREALAALETLPLDAAANNVGRACERDTLETLRAFGSDSFQHIVQSYLDTTPALLAAMRRSCRSEDGDQLRREAHTLGSTSLVLGARALAEMSDLLESRIKVDGWGACQDMLGRIEHEFQRVRTSLQRELERVSLTA